MEAVWAVLIFPVLAANVLAVALAGTVTEEGSIRTLAMPPERMVVTPPAGALLLNVTVQVVLEFEGRLAGAHCSAETNMGMVRDKFTAFVELFREAVTVVV